MDLRTFPFTMKRLNDLPPAPSGKGRLEYHDAGKKGLTLRVTESGVKTFTFHAWVNGKAKRATIGRFPETSLEIARRKVDEYWGAIAMGDDPIEAKRSAKRDFTFGELFEWYLATPSKHKPKTVDGYRQTYRTHLSHLANTRATDITRSDVRALHLRITKAGTAYAANRTIALVRAIYNRALREELIEGQNPAIGVQLNREESREVRLLPSQLGAFLAAVESYPDESLRDFFKLALLTGQRKANILAMRWSDVYLADRLWIIPETKNGRPQSVPLLDAELEILRRRKAKSNSPWVFPSHGKTGHIVAPKAAWRSVLKAAQIERGELRIHDLRRSFGSLMVDKGESLATIGKALGHMSQLTTSIYARLSLEPVREAKGKVHAVIEAARVKPYEQALDTAD